MADSEGKAEVNVVEKDLVNSLAISQLAVQEA